MIPQLSTNSQAILLLTTPLIVGRNSSGGELLSPGEYNRLARILRDHKRQPSDLLGPDSNRVLDECRNVFDVKRLTRLLDRGFLLSQAVDHWYTRAIWVISRADTELSQKWKARLKEDVPPILYGCGDLQLLDSKGFAVVGSREVDDALLMYASNVGRLTAIAGRSLISGGARGIDQAAMRDALSENKTAVGVLADSLERAALARDHREALMDKRLALISPYDPAAGFNVGHAMQRNKLIYALADAALVVNSDFNKGGTWAGAIEQLEKYNCGPIFVRTGDKVGKGNSALLRKGAQSWSDPIDARGFEAAISRALIPSANERPKQETLPLIVEEAPPREVTEKHEGQKQAVPNIAAPQSTGHELGGSSPESLFSAVVLVLKKELSSPATETEVAERLGVLRPQAKAWLARLVEEGKVKKLSKPVRFLWVQSD